MGCASGKSGDKNLKVGTQRRRLSVGEVEKEGTTTVDNVSAEADRGLITALQADDVIKMLGDDSGRKFSLGSATDASKTSFANKTMQEIGDKVDPAAQCLGYTCRKGLKPESPNQDSWSVLKVDGNFSLYAVYDGHGKTGHDVSNFVKDNLPKLIIRDQRFKTDEMPKMLKENFIKVQGLVGHMDRTKKLSAQMAGTTCSVAVHDHVKNKLTFAHVADSTIVMGTYTDASKTTLKGKAMTRDHKPDLKDERARIEKAGGRVVFDGYANHRVYAKNGRYPGLNMSRCLGDLLGHQDAGCSCEPEVSEHSITPLDHCLLVCSDGVWEFITPDEAVKIVSSHAPAKAMQAAEMLAKEAWDRWIQEEGGAVVDDITVILIHLQDIPQM
jgi:serine/threonine protein phosphatase PrpC